MNKKYYDTIESLKPSDEAVNNAVKAALEVEQSGKVIEMKPENNKKKFTIIGTIAASLAVIIALGAVFVPSSFNKSENSFFLVAKAAEATPDEAKKITDKEFTSLGSSLPFGGGSVKYDDEGGAESGKVVEFSQNFGFDFRCEGKNIDTVTYAFDNAKLFVDDKAAYKLVKYTGKSKFFSDTHPVKTHGYYSVTTNYTNQIANRDHPEIITSVIKATPETDEIINKYYDYDDGKIVPSDKAETKKIVNDYYNLLFDSFTVNVSVKYKDGSIDTQRLFFAVDNPYEETIKAKIA